MWAALNNVWLWYFGSYSKSGHLVSYLSSQSNENIVKQTSCLVIDGKKLPVLVACNDNIIIPYNYHHLHPAIFVNKNTGKVLHGAHLVFSKKWKLIKTKILPTSPWQNWNGRFSLLLQSISITAILSLCCKYNVTMDSRAPRYTISNNSPNWIPHQRNTTDHTQHMSIHPLAVCKCIPVVLFLYRRHFHSQYLLHLQGQHMSWWQLASLHTRTVNAIPPQPQAPWLAGTSLRPSWLYAGGRAPAAGAGR